ncbi:MAG TPA: YihY family inner membrane protein [Aquabacterium sp.]|uniref:YihY family inner membrane protein n=1 Tax=Aquabacterium sp. TaxID=1872578 RepID=UPI002D8D75F2|nr:YihY family inner membrane protein [Aquabacterium sp.]HET6788237.1 YihY family inner membrane protein [Aquabacterium sp.]HEX5372273.1 YihY family inner membrane protein [Aquabacterium sp.]
MTSYRRLITALQQWPWLATFKTLRMRFREDQLGVTAGSLTFTTTIALVPLMTVMLALFSAFPMFSRFRKALETQFLAGFVPDAIAKQVMIMLTRFADKASQLGGVGLIALGVTAMLLMLTIDHTLNAIWRVRRRRPIAQRVLVYWAALTLGPLLLGASLSVSSYLVSASRGWVGALPGGVGFLLGSVVFVLQTAGFAALFRYVPNTHVRWEHALSGGLFVSVGLELAQKGLAVYLSKVPVYATIYGAFAALPIFLVWIYLSWLIVLLGAVVAAYAPSLLSQVKRWPDTPGYQFQMALAIVRALAGVQHQPQAGYTAMALAQRLGTDPLQIEPIVETLQELDWVALLDEPEADEGGRYVLLCDPNGTKVGPLVQRLLLRSDAWSAGFWRHGGLDRMSLQEALTDEGGVGNGDKY